MLSIFFYFTIYKKDTEKEKPTKFQKTATEIILNCYNIELVGERINKTE